MPARKPQSLHVRHSTKAEIAKRQADEEALQAGRELPVNEPAQLVGNDVAAATWRRLIREYNRIEGAKIVGVLDRDLLIDYCLIMGQIDELDRMREKARELWETLSAEFNRMHGEASVDQTLEMASKMISAYDRVIKLDARVDAKRKLAFQYRQSMFLTPRSRTGVDPKKKDKEMPEDPFETHLNQVIDKISESDDEA